MKYIIEVKRRRSSVTQGSAHVLVNGVEVADFYDEIKLLKKGEHYYGENIGGWASVTPDESFIKGMLFHPFEELYHMSEKFRKMLDTAIEEAKKMKTTLEELRNNNIGYTLGKDGITEADLRLVNGIIDKIEQTRTRKPQPLDVVEYTDSFGCYYPNAIIDGDTYRNGSTALCECGSSYVSVSDDGTLCKSISGGAFPLIDKDKLRYIGKKEKIFWTFSTLGAGARHALYFKAEVSCFELNLREESLKRYTTKDYGYIFVHDWGDRTSDCGYKYTVTKGPYPHCAFRTEEELNEYLSLYEAVEEPGFNSNTLKKYWILKSAFVSVWTENEFGKIKADRTETTPKQREWIENMLTDINFHYECGLICNGKYDEFLRGL